MLKKLKNYTSFLLKKNELRKVDLLVLLLGGLIALAAAASLFFGRYELVRNIFLSFLFFCFLFVPGYALLSSRYFNKLTSVEKFCFSFGLSAFFYAISAIFSIVFIYKHCYYFNLFFLLAINAIGAIYIFNKRNGSGNAGDRKIIIRLAAIFLSFVVFLQIFVSLPYKMLNPLPDGPYVFKSSNNLHVKIQAMTGGLPADNFVPFVFSEFLLQKISFEKNRPMLPGQEVSNRTVLMGLDASFFLSIFSPAGQAKTDILDRYVYLNTPWPDVGKLGNDNRSFAAFLDLGIILNGLFLLATFLFISKLFGNTKAIAVVLLLLLFPYTVNQVIFTWPKFLMAYFLILSLYLVITKKYNYFLFPFALAMAYHSHPSAMIYIGFALAYWLVKNFRIDNLQKTIFSFSKIFLFFAALVAPWIIWTKFVVKIPSDLISQNLVSESYKLSYLVKTRLINLLYLFVPWMTKIPDFRTKITYEMTNYFPGAVGVYIFVCYYYILKYFKKYFWEIALLALGPLIFLILPWGKVMGVFAVLFAHPSVPLFFSIGAVLFSKNKKWTVIFISVQAILSIYVLWLGMYNLPLQLENFHVSKVFLTLLFSFQAVWFLLGLRLLVKKSEAVAIPQD